METSTAEKVVGKATDIQASAPLVKDAERTLRSYMAQPTNNQSSFLAMVKFYCCPFDMRYEELCEFRSKQFYEIIGRDCMAGLVGALVAIPMAMGFAIASGLQPVQGIVGGAIAGLLGALLGGSKYQVYGPTAAMIPVMNGIMSLYLPGGLLHTADLDGPQGSQEAFQRGQGLLVLVSLIAAIMLVGLSLARKGNLVDKVPNCILVGFTLGIAFTIAFALLEDALGIPRGDVHAVNPHILGDAVWAKLAHVQEQYGHVNGYAFFVTIATLICMQCCVRISVFIPAALVSIVVATTLAQTVWKDKELRTVFDSYGHIKQTLEFTPPVFHMGSAPMYQEIGIVLYYAVAIMLVGVVESLLCARMADTIAVNKVWRGLTPFHPSKELWAQGWINAIVPLFNGFPHNGALARTALNIKLGAVTPLAGIVKCIFCIIMAFALPRCLEMMPMAVIAGLLWFAALNMVTPAQLAQVFKDGGWTHVLVTCITCLLVVGTDFLHGIACGTILYCMGFFLAPHLPDMHDSDTEGTEEEKAALLKNSCV